MNIVSDGFIVYTKNHLTTQTPNFSNTFFAHCPIPIRIPASQWSFNFTSRLHVPLKIKCAGRRAFKDSASFVCAFYCCWTHVCGLVLNEGKRVANGLDSL
jgi:hypothetical protein